MADTLPNVSVPGNTWVELYAATGITPGAALFVENLGVSPLRIAIQETTPLAGHDAHRILETDETIGGVGVWVFSQSDAGKVNARAASSTPALPNDIPLTAFGEVSAAQPSPVVQILAANGLTDKILIATVDTGTITTTGLGEITASTGTGAGGLGSAVSEKFTPYRPGQGVKGLFTARFTAGVANSLQLAGLNNSGNGFNFGFINTLFGIIRRHSGIQEIQELEVSTAATGGETATVTVDGTAFMVPLTAGTANKNAGEIADSLTAQVPGWRFQQDGAIVTARKDLALVVSGAFAFSSSTAVAAWTQIDAGVAAIIDFIPQTAWNINTVPALDPTKGNVYQIVMQYLGYGAIVFAIEDSTTGRLIDVHRIQYANANVQPSVINPAMVIGVSAINAGNTSNIDVHTGSMATFNEGTDILTSTARTATASASIGVTETPLLTIRNRLTSPAGGANLAEFKILDITAASDTNKATIFRIYLNGVLTGADFSLVDAANSITSIDTASTAVTGTPISIITALSGAVAESSPERAFIGASDQITITGQVTVGADADMTVVVNYQEDI